MNDLDIVFTLEVLEDQMFLLNMVKSYIATHKHMELTECLAETSDMFLHPQEIINTKHSLVQNLLHTPTSDKMLLAALLRGISVCVTLLTDIYGKGPECKCHTVDDFDRIIGQECKFRWTRSNCNVLLDEIGMAFTFLQVYGTLPALPAGVWSFQTKCHLCRGKKCQAEINELLCRTKNGNNEICPHLIRYKSETSETETNTYKQAVQSMKEELFLKAGQEVLFPTLAHEEVSSDVCAKTNLLGMKMQLSRKQEQLNEVKRDVRSIYKGYIQAKNKRMQLDRPKCLNVTCYSLIGQLILHLCRRFLSLASFSPMLAKIGSRADRNKCSIRLKECLERVALQKINNKIIQQEYEKIFVDPLSLSSGNSCLLRYSIVAKQFMLTFGISAQELCSISNVWSHLSTKRVMQTDMLTAEERLLYAVYTLEVFSYWLSLIHVNDSFRLNLLRGDLDKQAQETGVIFLYDFEQLGLCLPDGTIVQSTYSDVTNLCIEYLSYLYHTGVCRHEPSVWYILQTEN